MISDLLLHLYRSSLTPIESGNLDDVRRGMIWALDPQTGGPTRERYSRVALFEFEYARESGRLLVEMQIMILLA